jgi:hypothetical protein
MRTRRAEQRRYTSGSTPSRRDGSEPHLDFIVTDLDGMLAQLCGPGISRVAGRDRDSMRRRDKSRLRVAVAKRAVADDVRADLRMEQRRIRLGRFLGVDTIIEEVRFAADSPLEEDGFELSVPR